MKLSIYIKIVISLFFVAALCLACVVTVNSYMLSSVSSLIISEEDSAAIKDVDCILVLGCLVRKDGTPSDMLADRINTGIDLYKSGVSAKLLMSGDHGQKDYNEVGTMKEYAMAEDVPSEDIFMDHAGFSTYESLYRAKEIFSAKKIVIVTQKYHLTRALYIARSLGIEAYGVPSDARTYSGQLVRDVREILARAKDFVYTIVMPDPTYLGEPIDLSGNGDVTNG